MTLAEAAAALAAAGIDEPRREARLLLAAAGERPFAALVARRGAREPMAFITGCRGFWSIDLAVSRDTLIPRPDSETLIEAALAAFPLRGAVNRILDLGTGTGCLLLAALVEFPQAWGVGVDRSPAAAALARRNADSLGLQARTAFVCADWAAALGGGFDLVLTNPPYIATRAIDGLMPEVALHEPALALDGGPDGLDAYRGIIAALPELLTAAGAAILELGAGQGPAVAALARQAGLHPQPPRSDLSGIPRALTVAKIPFGDGAPLV